MEVVNQLLKENNDAKNAVDDVLNEPTNNKLKNNVKTVKNTAEAAIETNNCLALTVKEEYRIVVFKNIIKKGLRITWKIALSIITMNFLNTFL